MLETRYARILVVFLTVLLVLVPQASRAQGPTQMTLQGTLTESKTSIAACTVCVPPSLSGSIKLEVDYVTGSLSGELSGQGSGQASMNLCISGKLINDRGTAEGQSSYSGQLTGSFDTNSGTISAKGTVRGTNSILSRWPARCWPSRRSLGPCSKEIRVGSALGFGGV